MDRRAYLIWIYALLLLGFNIVHADAGTIQLPQTGQTMCYDSSGNVIACTGTGQDGALLEGVAWPSPRFADNGDQTQTDQLTDLIWPKDGSGPTVGSCVGGTPSWQEALNYVACLNTNNYLGHNDWRLPNVNELESVVNAGQSDTATWLNEQGFSNVLSFYYWSSTSYAFDLSLGWLVGMSDYYGVTFINSKYYQFAAGVWPVRGGQPGSFGYSAIWRTGQTTCYDPSGNVIACTGTGQDGALQEGVAWPSPRFTDNGDQSVTDNLTNLIWTKNANSPGPSACGGGTLMTWQGALNYVACLNTYNYLGYMDWRLPNRKELHSLTDFSQHHPSISAANPFTNVQLSSFYWSSTSSGNYPSLVWGVDMAVGQVYAGGKTGAGYVWPVRSGQSGSLGNFTLSISNAGTGSGTVESSPSGISCGSTCSDSYSSGTIVTLTATPSSGSTFTGWSGGGCSGTGTCSVTMTAATSVTATFNTSGWTSVNTITVGSAGEDSAIQSGYNAAATGDTIEVQSGTTYVENDNFNRNVSVTLIGGYNGSFSTDSSYSIITGPLIISNGTVTAWNIIIQ
jgi:hypothetical protein